MEPNTIEETKCDRCAHNQSDHYESVLLAETDFEKAARAGLCKVFGCECIEFAPA